MQLIILNKVMHFAVFSIFCLAATSAIAERTVTFAWDATPDADSYTLYINGVPAGTTAATEITVQIPDAKTLANITAGAIDPVAITCRATVDNF